MSRWKNEDEYQDYRLEDWRQQRMDEMAEKRRAGFSRATRCTGCGSIMGKDDNHLVCEECRMGK